MGWNVIGSICKTYFHKTFVLFCKSAAIVKFTNMSLFVNEVVQQFIKLSLFTKIEQIQAKTVSSKNWVPKSVGIVK